MFPLRQTWNEVFPQSKLYALDVKINSIDPGWPITAQLKPKASSIHLNPMFLKGNEPTLAMQQKLRDKQRELLQLQARKLELELLTTKKRILEQEKQLSIQTESVSKEPSVELIKASEGIAGSPAVHPVAASGGLISAIVPPPKSRIAPVPQGMINMVKTRDPRLAKQQATAALHGGPSSTPAGGLNNHFGLVVPGSISIPPPMFGAGLMDPSNHAIAGSKQSSMLAKERDLGGKSRDNARSDALQEEGVARGKKLVTSSSTSNNSSSAHKSRREHDAKPRKDRKEHASSSSSASSRSSAKGSKSSSSSSSTRSSGSSSDKRKQRTHSASDGSPHGGRKSPHTSSPGKKKSSSEKSSSSHHLQSDQSPKGKSRSLESRTASDTVAAATAGAKSSQQARNNNVDSKKIGEYPAPAAAAGYVGSSSELDFRFGAGPQKRIKIDEQPVPEDTDDAIAAMMMVGQKASSEVQSKSDLHHIILLFSTPSGIGVLMVFGKCYRPPLCDSAKLKIRSGMG
uniref:CID domain-containing protein n=1 Tax=Anopheles maculatus TaxID=74869 RepID=A0A182T0C7_9DIPT